MKKLAIIAAFTSVAAASQAIVYSNISLKYGGFTAASFTPIQVGGSYVAVGTGVAAVPHKNPATQWIFNFTSATPITSLSISIAGFGLTNPNKVKLTALDVKDTGLVGSPDVYDLGAHGGAIVKTNGLGAFTDNFGTFTFSHGVTHGRVSIDDVFLGSVPTTITVNPPVPEPASMAVLGIGAIGLITRRRRNK